MKKLHSLITIPAAIFLLILSPSLLSQTCSYTWSTQNSGTTNILNTVKAVNEQVSWAAGSNATVRRTTDGGTTWLNANPNPGVIAGLINCIDAIDADNAWVTSTNSGSTFIYRTTNGGSLWQQVFSSSQTVIFGIEMTNASSGFAFGDPIAGVWQLLLTTNGGSSWQLSPNAPPAQQNIETCLPNSFQVSMPNIWWGTSITTVYRSTNAGVTFTSHAANVSGIYILAVHYNPAGIGFSASITMSKSTNGGLSYASLPAPGSGNIESIQGEDNNFWFIRGTGIYRSTDAGSSWEEVHTASLTQKHMDFPDNLSGCQMGWSVGHGGTIYKMTGGITGIGNNNNSVPSNYALMQNYPNPFNPETKIEFSLPKGGTADLRIYNAAGSELAVLVKSELEAGYHSVNFSPINLASGIYFYTLKAGGFTQTKKMLLIK